MLPRRERPLAQDLTSRAGVIKRTAKKMSAQSAWIVMASPMPIENISAALPPEIATAMFS